METRIGIDIRTLARGGRSGIEEYTAELLDHMLGLETGVRFKLFYSGWKKRPLGFDWLARPGVELCEFRFPNRLLDLGAYALDLPQLDRLLGVDRFFSPHIFLAPTGARCEKTVTFHDLSFVRHPEFYSSQKNFWHATMAPRRQARRADKIIAVSRSTRDDLVELYGVPAEKIRVIPPGLNSRMGKVYAPEEETRIRTRYGLGEEYVLCLCTLEPRKNLLSLVAAFDRSKRAGLLRGRPTRLILAGSKGWLYENIFRAVESSPARHDIVFAGPIAEEDKPAVYGMSGAFVYPSFYEGFGFPPLEAMLRGVPVITSDLSSIPETVRDAALLVDPADPDELRLALEAVLSDQALRARLIEKGTERVRAFSWERCARETLNYLIS